MRSKVLGVLGLALASAFTASGCSYEPELCRPINRRFVPDLSTAGDVTPPSATTIESIKWSSDDDDEVEASCDLVADTCHGVILSVRFQATDDITPAQRLGFKVKLISGEPPEDFELGPMPIEGSEARFAYSLPASAFSMELEVQAIDLNENLGPPTRFTVSQPAHRHSQAPLASMQWLGLVALAGVLGGRRRRRR